MSTTSWSAEAGMDGNNEGAVTSGTSTVDTNWDQSAGMGGAVPTDNINDLVERAETAATNAETAETNAETAQSYAEEWATKAEDSLVSTDAGGDGSTDYSALHHAAKASASATSASGSATTATTKAGEASDDADDAEKLAINPEDSQYTLSDGTTTGYSALHYSEKAGASASAASTSESNASDSASDASKLAVNAEDSQYTLSDGTTTGYSALHYNAKAQAAKTAAESARDATLSAYDQFDDRYLGAKASDPTLDNDGNALIGGALYFNTTDEVMKLYTGSVWAIAYADFSSSTTDVLAEGSTNLYYTDARVQAVSINNVVEDTTPQLGGTLDANGNTIDMGVNVITDTKVGQWDTAYGWGDHSTAGYLTSFTETNDLTAAVTWANVPDANITQTSVTQHQAALSISNTQVTGLGTAATTASTDYVGRTSATGSAEIPVGTTAQRDATPAAGMFRFNSTETQFEGYDGSEWGAIAGGGGGGNNTTFGLFEHANTITVNYSITSGNNAIAAGPVDIDSGVTVTIPTGSRWVIV